MSDQSILDSSKDYQEITESEAVNFNANNGDNAGWMDPDMPMRQFETVVSKEIDIFTHGGKVAPYDALVALMMNHALPMGSTILDVGASSGYYAVVLANRGFRYRYTAFERSPHFRAIAEKVFHVPFICGNAAGGDAISAFADKSWDVVLSGGMLMHTILWKSAINNMKRIAGKQLILHRTPIMASDTPTKYFIKKAYGLPCLEIHFNETELLNQVTEGNEWYLAQGQDVTWDETNLEGQISYLFKRQ